MKERPKGNARPKFVLGAECLFRENASGRSPRLGTVAQVMPPSCWSKLAVPEYYVRVDGAVFLARETELSHLDKGLTRA